MAPVCGGAGIGLPAFLLLESAQRRCCVSKLSLRWINRWHWTSHWSDSPLIDFITSESGPRGLLFDVLVPPTHTIVYMLNTLLWLEDRTNLLFTAKINSNKISEKYPH